MQDWSSESDYSLSNAGTFYTVPQDNDAGIYLDEGYDPLGRRRPDPMKARAPAGEYLQKSGYLAPSHKTHWSRAQASHYPPALATPGCPNGIGLGNYNTSPVPAYGIQRIQPPCGVQQMQPAHPGSNRPLPTQTKSGFDTGFHLSSRENIKPIYSVNWDERPMGYNPNAGPEWSRLAPSHQANMTGCSLPNSTYGSAYPGVPLQIQNMDAQSWAQNTPWAPGPPTWPSQNNYKEHFGGTKPGQSQQDPQAFTVTLEQIQLVFLFIILVMLSLILRALDKRFGIVGLTSSNKPDLAENIIQ